MPRCDHRNYDRIDRRHVHDLPMAIESDYPIQIYSFEENGWIGAERWVWSGDRLQAIPDVEGEIGIYELVPPEDRDRDEEIVHGSSGEEENDGD